MTLLARTTLTHGGTVYEPGDELDENATDKAGAPLPIDAAYLIASGQACDPDLCGDPDCPLHGTLVEGAGRELVGVEVPADGQAHEVTLDAKKPAGRKPATRKPTARKTTVKKPAGGSTS